MLISVTAKTGEPVLILSGKQLASKFDPVAEAQKWVEQITPLAAVSQVLFVVGAGSGQALAQLSERYPQAQIIAVTMYAEIIKFWCEHFAKTNQPPNLEFYLLGSVENFLSSELFFNIIEKTFVVIDHPSALAEGSQQLKTLKDALLGRTYSTFKAQAENHKSYSEVVKVLLPTIGALSIKNIADSLNLSPEASAQSRSEIAVLRELVK